MSDMRSRVLPAKLAKLDDFQLYALVRKAADLIFEYASSDSGTKDKPLLLDRRDCDVNPYHHQTANGLFLELYYGIPCILWTPWGSWGFGGGGGGHWVESVFSTILKRLGAVLYQPLRITQMGEFGPVYALSAVDGDPLPEAAELDKGGYDEYAVVEAAWGDLTKRYMVEKENQ